MIKSDINHVRVTCLSSINRTA